MRQGDNLNPENVEWETVTPEFLAELVPDQDVTTRYDEITYLQWATIHHKLSTIPPQVLEAVTPHIWCWVSSQDINSVHPAYYEAVVSKQLWAVPHSMQLKIHTFDKGKSHWHKRNDIRSTAFYMACKNGQIRFFAPEIIRQAPCDHKGWLMTGHTRMNDTPQDLKTAIEHLCEQGHLDKVLRPENWPDLWGELSAFEKILPDERSKTRVAEFRATEIARRLREGRGDQER